MRRWMPALLAAAAVEAAAGATAAAFVNAAGGHTVPLVLILSAAGAAAADMVLVPGWVWTPIPPVPSRLAVRAIIALLALGAAVCVGACTMLPVLLIGLRFLGGGGPSLLNTIVFGLPFMVGGGVAGLGAAIMEQGSGRPGKAHARSLPHVVGGAFGVLPVLLLVTIADTASEAAHPQPGTWWPLLALTPVALVAGGALRNILLAREAVQAGTAMASDEGLARRAGICCSTLLAIAAVAMVLAAT